jgi:hypothetical protein
MRSIGRRGVLPTNEKMAGSSFGQTKFIAPPEKEAVGTKPHGRTALERMIVDDFENNQPILGIIHPYATPNT